MTIQTIVGIILTVLAVAWVVFCAYLCLKGKTLDDIRVEVYKLFLEAEHKYTETKAGQDKMNWVINKAWDLLPKWAKKFISEDTLRKIVQCWFDSVKDLLDDGKFNKSVKDDE